MRTPEEIEKQVLGLQEMKKTLPQINFFGDDNWEKIDAQISVLKKEKTIDDFDEEEEELYNSVAMADEWLCGFYNEDLFE